jgi:uncharacterized protein YcbX
MNHTIMTVKLSAIHIYPVKSLGAVSLTESIVTSRGLANDRRFMVVDSGGEFFTQREVTRMATVWVELEGGRLTLSAPDMHAVSFDAQPVEQPSRLVRVWSSHVPAHAVSAEADAWLSTLLGEQAQLVYMPESSERKINANYAPDGEVVSFADGFPLLIASEASLADLNARIVQNGGSAIPMNRFRPNLVISGCEAFAEDRLGEIRVGEAIFRATKPCVRCQVTTTDQATGEIRGPEPLRALATYRNSSDGVMFGMNLIPVKRGTVRVGDEVQFIA